MLPRDSTLETEHCRLKILNSSDVDFIFSAIRFPGFNEGIQWELFPIEMN